MNQYIEIEYKPDWHSNPNHWNFWFDLNGNQHREKAPSLVYSTGYWNWCIQGKLQKEGTNGWNGQ